MADKKEKRKKEVPGHAADEKLNAQIDAVLRTEEGQAFWAHLANFCGFFVSSLKRKADGEIAVSTTECLEAQRNVYLQLRKRPSRELLRRAEDLAEAPPTKPKEEGKK